MAKRVQQRKTAARTATAPNVNRAVDYASFAESMMDTSLYGVGAYFCDRHPDLVEDVIDESASIEQIGLQAYATANKLSFEECLQTLITGLAVRYYKAIAS
ncbi:MAG: hypothetical protein JJE27_08255 [Thermoleophilia bacterium]|nr:hypothetical protein [Thermoleophilia bacterium]